MDADGKSPPTRLPISPNHIVGSNPVDATGLGGAPGSLIAVENILMDARFLRGLDYAPCSAKGQLFFLRRCIDGTAPTAGIGNSVTAPLDDPFSASLR